MAFNGVQPWDGPFFLMPGKWMDCGITFSSTSWFNPTGDQGAQWIMANPIIEGKPIRLQVGMFRKEVDYMDATAAGSETTFFHPYIRYVVRVTNVGNYPCHFNLQGGGNV